MKRKTKTNKKNSLIKEYELQLEGLELPGEFGDDVAKKPDQKGHLSILKQGEIGF